MIISAKRMPLGRASGNPSLSAITQKPKKPSPLPTILIQTPSTTMSLDHLTTKIRAFRDERDWAQFHNPKDMAIAISIEAGELLEHFLWQSPPELDARIASRREQIEEEIADIGIYLTELADILGIDLLAAMDRKIAKNALKYPAHRVKGSSKKYNEYPEESVGEGQVAVDSVCRIRQDGQFRVPRHS